MSESKFKTMRHIETVRNYINACVKELLSRAEKHDQTKLESPEVEYFEKFTPLLRDLEYGSDEYRNCLNGMKPAIEHHYLHNKHHPEYWRAENPSATGVADMDLIDILEMLCDWKAAGMRHSTGDIFKSIKINQKRWGFSDELAELMRNTASRILNDSVFHKANES